MGSIPDSILIMIMLTNQHGSEELAGQSVGDAGFLDAGTRRCCSLAPLEGCVQVLSPQPGARSFCCESLALGEAWPQAGMRAMPHLC